MRQRNVKNQDEILNSFKRYIQNPEINKGNWNNGKYKAIHIEIGMGKGAFITTLASNNPDVLYIGIEVCKSVLALATKKIEKFEEENNIKLDNLLIISSDAVKLNEVFEKEEVDKIYLNFSDPWPKKKHAKRRLTSDTFIKIYKDILKKDGIIEFKTDNRKLFEYSIISLNDCKVNIEYISLDLHKEDIYNIQTEYEKKFSEFGPIYKLIFKF